MSEHTPGPWKIVRGGGYAYNSIEGSDIIHTNGRDYGVYGSMKSYSERVCENLGDLELPGPMANANLIAAAPEILEALRDAVAEINCLTPQAHFMTDAERKGRAAIAKAEGKS